MYFFRGGGQDRFRSNYKYVFSRLSLFENLKTVEVSWVVHSSGKGFQSRGLGKQRRLQLLQPLRAFGESNPAVVLRVQDRDDCLSDSRSCIMKGVVEYMQELEMSTES